MEEIKILVVALVSFLTQENIPVVAKSAEIHIDRVYRQITIQQNDVFSMEQYRDMAKAGLDTLMQIRTLRADMSPLRLTSNNFFEEDGKLNAVLHLQYDDLKDLRKISFYSDEEENLSYSYMDDYDYDLQTGRIDGRYVRFDIDQNVKFKMVRKGELPEGTYSLLDDWKALKAAKYEDVTEHFSVKDFKKLRKYILKKGTGRSFRNIENNNPYYQFDNVGVYLASSTQYQDHNDRLPTEDYDNVILSGDGQFNLYLFDENIENSNPYLLNDKVYFAKPDHLDSEILLKYLDKIKQEL